MADTAQKLMTHKEFFLWGLEQEDRCELVDGVPVVRDVTPTGQAGASGIHDTIVVNCVVALARQLHGKRCRAATGDIAMRTGDRKTRRPDVHMVCDPPDATTDETGDVQLIVEVISQSNKGLAWQRKLEQYKARTDLEYLMLIEQNPHDVLLVA